MRTDRDGEYPVKISFDEDDKQYVAEFLDLPGCTAAGATVADAYERALVAKKEWIELAIEQGLPIPRPSRAEEYSGRILLRLPTSLHAMLAERAKLQATSLNQYAVYLLSGAIVGDSVSTQIEQLKQRMDSLVKGLDVLSTSVQSHSLIARQLSTMLGSQTLSTQLSGGLYQAQRGSSPQDDLSGSSRPC